MIYVGSNDGLLHAFSIEDGAEKWAFLPKSLHAKLNQAADGASYDPCSTSYCHQYAAGRLAPGGRRARALRRRPASSGARCSWSGSGRAGRPTPRSTSPPGKGFSDATSPARFLWEFTDADLGESWSDPVIERVRDAAGANERAWGVYFGSGYSENDNTQYLQGGLPLRAGGRHRQRAVERRREHDQQDQADPGGREPEFHRPERRGPRSRARS